MILLIVFVFFNCFKVLILKKIKKILFSCIFKKPVITFLFFILFLNQANHVILWIIINAHR